ncbi:MAG: hypothetical protein ACLFQX_02645 [Candidatus Kapaibacterium sp.]
MKRIYPFAFILICVAMLAYSPHSATAQFTSKTYISGGLSTLAMPGETPNTLPMVQRDTTKEQITGGSFNGSQPGIGLQFLFVLDKEENFRIPLGFDYNFFRAAERIPISAFYEARLKHRVDVAGINLGLHYAFLKFPLAQAKIYGGIEARATYVFNGEFQKIQNYKLDDLMDEDVTIPTKPDVWRFGGQARLGIEGEIFDPVYINTSVAFGVINLIGRDDQRGELFTILSQYENEESLVSVINFSFLIQYKF